MDETNKPSANGRLESHLINNWNSLKIEHLNTTSSLSDTVQLSLNSTKSSNSHQITAPTAKLLNIMFEPKLISPKESC